MILVLFLSVKHTRFMDNKKFFVEKRGKKAWVVIRQLPHDPRYKLGSHIPGYGKVVALQEAR
jgi:hypothetical protein